MSDNFLQSTEQPVGSLLPTKPASPLTWPDESLNRAFLKDRLDDFQAWLAEAFNAGVPAETLIDARALYIDQLLRQFRRAIGARFDNDKADNCFALELVGHADNGSFSDLVMLSQH